MSKKYLYSKKQFSENDLPSNRKEVFFDVLKLHYFSLIKIGLIILLFALPLFIINFFKDYSFIIAHESGESNVVILIVLCSIEVLAVLLMSIPVAGLGRIYREYAWLEPVFFTNDFKTSLKENFKPTFISFIWIAILNLIFNIIYYFLNNGWIIAIPFGFNIAVFFPILMHAIFINFTYTNKYWTNFKLACFFYLKHLPSTMLCIILICAFKVYDLFQFTNIIAILTKNFVFIIILLFIMPMIFLGTQLNELRIFDKHINSVRFPELVNKGIHQKNEDKEDTNIEQKEPTTKE